MAEFRIAWLPGDGIGIEVMEAARICLDALKLDAEYLHGDIGWEFWCKEGDAFPQRTIELLAQRRARCSAPSPPSRSRPPRRSSCPELQRQGHWSTAPPSCACASSSTSTSACGPARPTRGNPLNFKEGIDLVVFRENTEDLYAGCRVQPGAGGARATLLAKLCQALRALRRASRATSTPSPARSTRGRAASASSARPSSSRKQVQAQEGHRRPQGQRCARHRRAVPGDGQGRGQGVPRHQAWTTPTSTP